MTRRAGVVTAFVKRVDAGQGRVMVEYRGMEDGLLSPWAYVAAPMSGPSRGALFMPESGDEVLVAYADGDFDHPYVLGFLWNGEQTSPETEAHNRVIVTPGGHQLRFEDKSNDTRIVLKSNGGHSVTLEDQASGPKLQIETNGNREVLLDDTPGTGKVQITSGAHQVTMDDTPGGQRVQIQAGQGVGVTILMNVTPPSLTINVGAGNSITVSDAGVALNALGGANITVAGVANITASATNITTGALNVTSGLASFTGVVQASAVVTNSVVSSAYNAGVPGNLFGL